MAGAAWEMTMRAAANARQATADTVAAAASDTAGIAARAAADVHDEAVARALGVAAAAVEALEAVAARRPDGNDDQAQLAAEAIAATVAADAAVQANATATAAAAVAVAVSTASAAAALAAAAAAARVEWEASAFAIADGLVVDSSADTVAVADAVVQSARKVEKLAARRDVVAALRESEQRFSYTFDRAPVGMLLVSLSPQDPGRVLRVNRALSELTGRAESELLALHEGDLCHVDDRAVQAALLADVAANGRHSPEAVARWVHADGRELLVRLSAHAVREGPLAPAYAVYQVQDITAQRRAEAALRVREEGFRVAFDHARTGLMFLDLDGGIRQVNPALSMLLDRQPEELAGHPIEMLAGEDDQEAIANGIEGLVAGSRVSYEAEHQLGRPDGSQVWAVLRGSLVQDLQGRPSYLVFEITDLTERKDAEFRLAHQAVHDDLTGLPNRVLLHDHLEQACARAERSGTHIAVLFVDVDEFKDVNDSLGHLAGDQVLIEFSDRVAACLRGTDTAARLGGDEFVLVCEDLNDPGEATAVAQRIAAAMAAPFNVTGGQIRITASVGITTASTSTAPEELIRNADTAMYRAKINGKNRHEVYESGMSAGVVRQITVAQELERALANDELRLRYQPMYNMLSGALVGVEALLRWEHPTRGLLTPAHFLDVAEGRRLMTPIGDWVVATAAAQASLWQQQAGARAPDVWVNISGNQLGTQHLARVLDRVLGETGLDPSKLGLEITERQLIGRGDEVRADLEAIHRLGAKLAVDDFGTGYNSLDYLCRFAFDEIKIDQSFIAGLGQDRADTAVTSSVVALGHALDLVVVAEGVETQDQYDRLRELGCDVSQGFLLHRPAPPETIDLILQVNPAHVEAQP